MILLRIRKARTLPDEAKYAGAVKELVPILGNERNIAREHVEDLKENNYCLVRRTKQKTIAVHIQQLTADNTGCAIKIYTTQEKSSIPMEGMYADDRYLQGTIKFQGVQVEIIREAQHLNSTQNSKRERNQRRIDIAEGSKE